MAVDILIFAAVAAFLVYRLSSVLGTRHGDERQRPNPFAAPPAPRPGDKRGEVVTLAAPLPRRREAAPADMAAIVDAASNADGRVETGLSEIALADAVFDPLHFVEGAKAAFEMIVTAYARGDLDTIRPLVSPRLYADFAAGVKAREEKGHKAHVEIHRIKAARITEAHLGGAMAYVTVDFDVEETAWTKDRDGNTVEGDEGRIFSVEDIWTFTRDTRSHDPNWTLIETRAAEK